MQRRPAPNVTPYMPDGGPDGGKAMDHTAPHATTPLPAAGGALLTDWLPPGWTVLGTLADAARDGAFGGCHLIVHPMHGAILLDLVAEPTPGAEARLARTLAEGGFHRRHPDALAVWYVHLHPARLSRFASLLEDALAGQAAPAAPADGGWIDAMARSLQADLAWRKGVDRAADALWGAGRPGLDGAPARVPMVPADASRPKRGAALVLVGLGLTFALGLLAGKLLWLPAPPAPIPGAPQAMAPRAGQQAEPPATERTTAPGSPAEAAQAAPQAAEATTPDDRTAADPPAPAVLQPHAPAALPDIAAKPAASPAEASGAHAVAAPAMRESVAPPPRRRVERPQVVYDRRCSEAQFRWQQGERLSWGEMAYVREGCVGSARGR